MRGAPDLALRAWLAVLLSVCAVGSTSAAVLPVGFVESVAVSDVPQAIDFDWDPDGGLWIVGKQGEVWVVRESIALAAQLAVESSADAGLIGVAIDPDYADNQHVWLYYLNPLPMTNRVSRFTNSDDTLIDETVMLEIDSASIGYNGGCLGFLPDGTLLVGMAMNGQPASVQDPFTLKGKLLRINRDGSVPADNPFADGVAGDPRVWATGLRNPWRCAVQPGTGEVFIGDVGWQQWEEVNVGVAGANYGFPLIEGPGQPTGPQPQVEEPFYAFPHMPLPEHHAVIGGDFAELGDFPVEYAGDYFFADHNQEKLLRMRFDASNELLAVEDFGTSMQWPVSIEFGPDGALYYAAWYTNEIRKIDWVGEAGAGGSVPDDMLIYRYDSLDGQITLVWEPSCNAGDTDYAIFIGTIPDFTVVDAILCSTNGNTARSLWPEPEDTFYLVVPHNQFWQGSFGRDSQGNERAMTGTFCHAQSITPCP